MAIVAAGCGGDDGNGDSAGTSTQAAKGTVDPRDVADEFAKAGLRLVSVTGPETLKEGETAEEPGCIDSSTSGSDGETDTDEVRTTTFESTPCATVESAPPTKVTREQSLSEGVFQAAVFRSADVAEANVDGMTDFPARAVCNVVIGYDFQSEEKKDAIKNVVDALKERCGADEVTESDVEAVEGPVQVELPGAASAGERRKALFATSLTAVDGRDLVIAGSGQGAKIRTDGKVMAIVSCVGYGDQIAIKFDEEAASAPCDRFNAGPVGFELELGSGETAVEVVEPEAPSQWEVVIVRAADVDEAAATPAGGKAGSK